MCGIIGFTSATKKPELIEKFLKELSHRGPDHQEYIEIDLGNYYLYLGSTRLTIRGDSSCNMPMLNKKGDCIVYNGEIFDVKALSKEYELTLKKNDTFYLLDFLSKEHFDLNKINGMFSFAFYNKSQQSLTLARDRFGIKPLWYTNFNDEFYFSSEQHSLINLFNVKDVSNENLYNTLIFNGVTKANNIIPKIYQLKPGHKLLLDSNKKTSVEKFYNSIDTNTSTKDTSIKNFEDIMLEVLEDHLDADTQVDMFLSGGIDSSILAYLTKKKLNKELRHFSLKFSNKSFDESDNFLQVSNRLNLEPIVFEINKEEIPEIVDEAIKNMNSLILDPSYIPTYYLSKETSKYTKAVVSGDGADEIFGGYEWYRANKIKGLIPFTNSLIFSNIISFVLKNSKSNKYLGLSEKANIFLNIPIQIH